MEIKDLGDCVSSWDAKLKLKKEKGTAGMVCGGGQSRNLHLTSRDSKRGHSSLRASRCGQEPRESLSTSAGISSTFVMPSHSSRHKLRRFFVSRRTTSRRLQDESERRVKLLLRRRTSVNPSQLSSRSSLHKRHQLTWADHGLVDVRFTTESTRVLRRGNAHPTA
jgi:hypothetical protein